MNFIISLVVILALFTTFSTFLSYGTGIYYSPLEVMVNILVIIGYLILAKLLGILCFLLSLGSKDEIK